MSGDHVIIQFDKILRTMLAPAATLRPVPGEDIPESVMSDDQRRQAAALMRVNHCGEICAQALYQGQALTAQNRKVRDELEQASREETEHLAWTERRIAELRGRKSLLNPIWYGGSLALGMVAGKCGDRWNLGFLAETERQVEAHLKSHLERLPQSDARSRAIVEQMKTDEARHAQTALGLGGARLPAVVRSGMKLMSGIMTTLSYRI